MIRKSTAVWQGDGLHGKGHLTTQSGVFREQPYSFQTRFQSEDGKAGTNPEELIAAAHSGCFSMALSHGLSEAGHPPTSITTSADVTFGLPEGISGIRLTVHGVVPGITAAEFAAAAEDAKKNCPVSKALTGTTIELTATLDQ